MLIRSIGWVGKVKMERMRVRKELSERWRRSSGLVRQALPILWVSFTIRKLCRADHTGILFASLISMPFEIALCNAQVEQGRTTCRDL